MNSMKKVILISAGDPASISTEITIKAIQSSRINKNIKPIVVSNSNLIENCKKIIKSNVQLNEIEDKVKAMPTLFSCILAAVKIVVNFPPIQCPIDNPARTTAITDVHV